MAGGMRLSSAKRRIQLRLEQHPGRRTLSKCAHSVVISAERWPDYVRLSDLEPKFTCQICGLRGADVRPLFEQARMGTGV